MGVHDLRVMARLELMKGDNPMQELFNLFYLYDYMAMHTIDEEYREYTHLRDYVTKLIEDMGAE